MFTLKYWEVTLSPTKVVSGSTNFGISAPSRGVCGSVVEAQARQAAVGTNIPAPATAPILRNVRRDGITVNLLSSVHAIKHENPLPRPPATLANMEEVRIFIRCATR